MAAVSAFGTPPAWQTPLQWPVAVDAQAPDRIAFGALKTAVVGSLLALTVLDRFGLRILPGEIYSAHPALLALYGLFVIMLITGAAELNVRGALCYAAVAIAGGLSFLVNANFGDPQYVSLPSWLLLMVVYAPFVVSLRYGPISASLWPWVTNMYMAFALLVALAGIAQFAAQFVFRPAWLFDYTLMIPAPIRGFEFWKTVHPVGDWFKSNGFFLREPSFLSLQMGFALLCELSLNRRRWVMAVLALGLVLSYSGSGLLVLAVGLLFPLGRKSLLQLTGAAVLAAFVFYVFGDVLNLSYTVDRLDEFESNKSSAYCRFIEPALVTYEDIDTSEWAVFLGHGPGTLAKMHGTCETTFAKAPFEYGLLGTFGLIALVFTALGRASVPVRIRAGLALQWATQPVLLGGDWVLLAYLLCAMWPEGSASLRRER